MRSNPFGTARAPLRFLAAFVAVAGIIGVWVWFASQMDAHERLQRCNAVVDASVIKVLERSRTGLPSVVLVALPGGVRAELDVRSDADQAAVESDTVRVAWCPGYVAPVQSLDEFRRGATSDLGTALFVTFALAAIGLVGFFWVFKPTDDVGDEAMQT